MPPTEDPVKIANKVRELNNGTGTDWVPVDTIYAPLKFTYNAINQGKTDDSLSYPMRMFVNTRTGEIKIYAAKMFLRD